MTTQNDIVTEAMQYAKQELGISYADFGRWAVKDASFYSRVARGTRLRANEYEAALGFAVKRINQHIAALEDRQAYERREAA